MTSFKQPRLSTLVSGSSGNACLVSLGDTHVLIDAGLPLKRLSEGLRTLGLTVHDLTAVLITHEHTDHISGLTPLLRETGLPVYASGGTAAALVSLCPFAVPFLHGFSAGTALTLGDIEVKSFSTPHDSADSVGYLFYLDTVRAAVATDLGHMPPDILALIFGADVVLLEANHDVDMLQNSAYPAFLKRRILGARGHLSNVAARDAAQTLIRHGTRHLVLAHLSDRNNDPQTAYDTVAEALLADGCVLGEDVFLSVAARKTPQLHYGVNT